MTDEPANSAFDRWILHLVRLLQSHAVSLSEAEQRIRTQAPPFDSRRLLAVAEEVLSQLQLMTLEERRQLAAVTLAGVTARGADDGTLRRARELAILTAIDVLAERHDGSVFQRASAVASNLIDHARSRGDHAGEARALLLAGRLHLEPFAPDPAYDQLEMGLLLRQARQRWIAGLEGVDGLPGGQMPSRGELLAAAVSHFEAAAERAVGALRGVALAYLAFGAFARTLSGDDASQGSAKRLAHRAVQVLEPGHDPLAESRLRWILTYDEPWVRPQDSVTMWPMAPMVLQYGFHGAAAAHVLAIRAMQPIIPPNELVTLAHEVLSALPDDGLEQTKVWLRTRLGHHLPQDPTSCRDHVRGRGERAVRRAVRRATASRPDRVPLIAARVHALYHRVHYDFQEIKAVYELINDAPHDVVSAFLLIRGILALNSATKDFRSNPGQSGLSFAIAARDFTALEYPGWALSCLEMMEDRLRAEDAALVGRNIGHAVELIVNLADYSIARLDEAGSKALQGCLSIILRGLAAAGTDVAVDQIHLISQLAKARAFSCAVGAADALSPTSEQVRVLEAIRSAERDFGAPTPASVDETLDWFEFRLASYVSPAESTPGSTPEQVVRNLKVEYHRHATRALARSTLQGARPRSIDDVQANLPGDTLVVSFYFGEIHEEYGYGVLAEVLARDGAVVFALYNPQGDHLHHTTVFEDRGVDQVGIGRREISIFSFLMSRLLSAIREDPLHRPVARQAQGRLNDMADLLEPLLRWLEQATSDGSYPHLCVWPHKAIYFLPLWLVPFNDGILADFCTVTFVPSMLHLPEVPSKSAREPRSGVGVLAVGCADGGISYGLRSEPSLETTADAIGAMFGCEALTGDQATPETVLTKVGQVAFIHIGAHGAQDLAAPSFHCLFLNADADGEGRLFAHQITETDLRGVRLVTLSACESSLIRYDYNDNLVGLSSAFLLAGAAAVVGALWPVTAPVADVFFRTLYARLADGARTLRAFRNARQETRTQFPQHRDWGAFCFLGRAEEEGDATGLERGSTHAPADARR